MPNYIQVCAWSCIAFWGSSALHLASAPCEADATPSLENSELLQGHPESAATSGIASFPLPTRSVIARIEKAFLFSKHGLALNGSGYFSFGKWYWRVPVKKCIAAVQAAHYEDSDSSTFVPFHRWDEVFQHAVFDMLPKLAFSCNWLHDNPSVTILAINELQIGLMREVCTLPHKRFRLFSQQEHIRYKAIFVPYFTDTSGHAYAMGLAPYQSLTPLGTSQTQHAVVYLRRRKGTKRSVQNEDDVISFLKERFGERLRIVTPKNNWKEDRQLLGDANTIIGPHGGAMSNMVFAAPGSAVIEFLPVERLQANRQNSRPCYLGLAAALGFHYDHVEVDDFNFNKPMTVPIKSLAAALDRVHANPPWVSSTEDQTADQRQLMSSSPVADEFEPW